MNRDYILVSEEDDLTRERLSTLSYNVVFSYGLFIRRGSQSRNVVTARTALAYIDQLRQKIDAIEKQVKKYIDNHE